MDQSFTHLNLRHIGANEQAELANVTDQFDVLGLMGPNSRALPSSVTGAELSNAAFPFGTTQFLKIGRATVHAVRLTYVGELGWELHLPMEQLPMVYDKIHAAGKEFGRANAGHYAINSLRLEKGFRAWGLNFRRMIHRSKPASPSPSIGTSRFSGAMRC